MLSTKKVIALMIDYYSPGYKAGGPITTIKNMLMHLGSEFEFRLITRCYDLGEKGDYPDVEQNKWIEVEGGKIYYLARSDISFKGVKRVLSAFDYDVLYLNSFFSIPFSLMPIVLGRLGLISSQRIILAPRGEFSSGALGLNARRKSVYLQAAKLLGLYRNVYWQASSQYEYADIRRLFSKAVAMIAPDLPPAIASVSDLDDCCRPNKVEKELKLLFLSRVSRMKGLYEAISVLMTETAKIDFDIFGPIEDQRYWAECQALIKTLPDNVKVNYRGSVKPNEVPALMREYHLFILPTKGENFGHVVIESLACGCPVLISDQTQWQGLENESAGIVASLHELSEFTEAIKSFAEMNSVEWTKWSVGARNYVDKKVNLSETITQNKRLLNG